MLEKSTNMPKRRGFLCKMNVKCNLIGAKPSLHMSIKLNASENIWSSLLDAFFTKYLPKRGFFMQIL